MKAPTGDELQGTYELVEGAADVTFDTDNECGYDHTGNGTEMFWDGALTLQIADVTMFLDESGHDWLLHHLIPDEAEPLSQATINLFNAEILYGQALRSAEKLVGHMAALPKDAAVRAYIDGPGAVAALEPVYEAAKAASIAAWNAEIATQCLVSVE